MSAYRELCLYISRIVKQEEAHRATRKQTENYSVAKYNQSRTSLVKYSRGISVAQSVSKMRKHART